MGSVTGNHVLKYAYSIYFKREVKERKNNTEKEKNKINKKELVRLAFGEQ